VLQREALFLQPQGGLGSREPLLPVESPAPFRRVAQRVEAREKRIEKNARQSQRPEGSLLGYAGRGARNRTGVCNGSENDGKLVALQREVGGRCASSGRSKVRASFMRSHVY
jgi:hypothetical protein